MFARTDNLTYNYNIRGWLSSINKPYLSANTSTSAPSAGNYFGMELDYDYGFTLGNSTAILPGLNGNLPVINTPGPLAMIMTMQTGY